mmetsp:Transcript_43226/g.108229  ORF Transcript_43226/g.108229 Transcript_43226/m.108229 type:complete len:412 (+) Transcript_43226:20-1255(+)
MVETQEKNTERKGKDEAMAAATPLTPPPPSNARGGAAGEGKPKDAKEAESWGVMGPSVLFSCSSIGMILLNKAVMRVYPHPSATLILQNMSTIILILLSGGAKGTKLKVSTAVAWLPVACFFCFNLFSSLQSMKYIGVATFSVLRYLQPLFSVPMDYFIRGVKTKLLCIVLLAIVFCGSVMYAHNDLEFHTSGYMWALLHNASMTCYLILVKLMNSRLDIPANEMSLYNNILSLPFLAFLSFFVGEFSKDLTTPLLRDFWAQLIVAASCFGGFCVSLTAFQAQKVLSPTSFITLNNVSKLPAIVISTFIFNASMSVLSAAGVVVSLGGGYAYALATTGNFSQQQGFTILMAAFPLITCLVSLHFAGSSFDEIQVLAKGLSRMDIKGMSIGRVVDKEGGRWGKREMLENKSS